MSNSLLPKKERKIYVRINITFFQCLLIVYENSMRKKITPCIEDEGEILKEVESFYGHLYKSTKFNYVARITRNKLLRYVNTKSTTVDPTEQSRS